jgi:hypothetical protein
MSDHHTDRTALGFAKLVVVLADLPLTIKVVESDYVTATGPLPVRISARVDGQNWVTSMLPEGYGNIVATGRGAVAAQVITGTVVTGRNSSASEDGPADLGLILEVPTGVTVRVDSAVSMPDQSDFTDITLVDNR